MRHVFSLGFCLKIVSRYMGARLHTTAKLHSLHPHPDNPTGFYTHQLFQHPRYKMSVCRDQSPTHGGVTMAISLGFKKTIQVPDRFQLDWDPRASGMTRTQELGYLQRQILPATIFPESSWNSGHGTGKVWDGGAGTLDSAGWPRAHGAGVESSHLQNWRWRTSAMSSSGLAASPRKRRRYQGQPPAKSPQL
jgi:hypothetical protein